MIMSYLVINGGKKLHGSIRNQTAKNSAVAILCACLMIKGKTTVKDAPRIEEVNRILEILASVGVKVKKSGRNLLIDVPEKLNLENINKIACEATRSSILLWGALARRAKEYKLYKSGVCHLGERTVRPHWYGLKNFGIKIESKECFYEVKNPERLSAGKIVMYESGDTATENVIMAAVCAPGTTTVKMASANYMVQDLCYFLERAGAKISGIGSTTLVITGVKFLRPGAGYPIMPDPIAAMTCLAAGIATSSRLNVVNCPLEFLGLELLKLEMMGQKYKIKRERKSRNGKFIVADIEIFPSKLIALPDKIYGRPFPGLNIDNLPFFAPILAKAKGKTLMHDWAYENRAAHYLELQKMGVKITLLDPHRLLVEGPAKFIPNELESPLALRPAAAVLICMLAAKGRSVLKNTYMIDRGYENLYNVLNRAGADIKLITNNQ